MYPSPPSSSADAKSPATTVSTAPHAGPAPANLYAYAPVYDSDNDDDKNDVHPSSAASASAKLLPPPDYYGTISTPATETAGLVVNHHHYHHYSTPNSPTSTTFASTSAPPASCTSAVASLTKRTLVFFTRAVVICCCFAILTILLAALTAGSMVHFAPGRLPGLSGDPAATVVDGVEWPCGGSAGVDPIRALRQQWIVAQAGELKVNVSGVASGAVRYAGFDVDPEFAVAGGKVVVDVSVHVSHERLIPLVSARGDTAAGLVEVETPESRDMSRIFRECVIASVNVSMVHTTSASASRASNSLGSIKTLKVDTVNLNHYLSSVALRRRSPSTSSSSSSTSSSPSISTRAAPQGWTGLDALAISTTNGHMQLTPSGPWSIHSALSLTTTNGNIDLAGPLRFAGTRLDAESTNGNLHLRAMLLAPASPATSSSPVAITASTTNGNIDLGVADLLPQARVLASATNGNVLVTAGPDARLDSAKLRAATALGNAQAASRAAGWPRKSVKGNGWMGGVAELVLRKVKKEQEGQQVVEVVEVEVGAGEEMSEEVGVASRGSKKRRDDDESDQGDEGRAEVTASSTTGNAVVAMDDLLLVRVDRR